MPPVIAALPLIASIVVTVIKVSLLVKALILIAATVLVMVLTKKQGTRAQANQLNQGQELGTKISPSVPRTVPVGQTAVGPSCHFVFTGTNDSSKPNRYLYRVWQISDQPIDTLLGIFEGKTQLTFSGDITTGWYACNQHLSKTGSPCMWVRVYKGVFSGAVADATLISESGGLWTSSHKGTGLAYAIVKMDYDSDAFPNGEPELVFQMKGARIYDDRHDSTVVGGSGTQRLNDPTTWAWSENTANILAQYLRGFYINGKIIVGVGAEQRDLLPQMLFSAYNTCDSAVTTASGTEARYTTGYNIQSDQSADTIIQDMMLAMDGQVFDRGGSITIWPGAVRSPVLNISSQDIDWTAEKSWQPRPSLDNMINYVSGNFVDKDNYFSEKDIPPRFNSAWEADDGGERFATFLSMKAVNRWSQAQRLAKRTHDASRLGGVASCVGGIWLLELEQGDWCTMTIPRWDMVSKYMQIQEITLTQDLRVAIVASEVATSLDSWDHAVDEFARTDTFWNPPGYTLPVPTFTLAGYSTFAQPSGVQDFGFTLTPTAPVDVTGNFATGIEVEWAPASDHTLTHAAGTMNFDQVKKTVVGLLPGTTYSVRARTVDSGNRHSSWSAWSDVTTPTQNTTTTPASVVVDSPLIIYASVAGVPKSGEIPKDIAVHLRQLGVDVASGVSWSATRQTGNATATITGTGDAVFTVTGPNDSSLTAESLFQIQADYAGNSYFAPIKVLKQNDPPTNTGGGGGSGGGSSTTTTLSDAGSTSYAGATSAILTAAAGAGGNVDLLAPIEFWCNTNGTQGAYGKWQWRAIGGSFADVAAEVGSSYGADKVPLDPNPGYIEVGVTKGSLTPGTSYEFQFQWRLSGAGPSIRKGNGVLSATGS